MLLPKPWCFLSDRLIHLLCALDSVGCFFESPPGYAPILSWCPRSAQEGEKFACIQSVRTLSALPHTYHHHEVQAKQAPSIVVFAFDEDVAVPGVTNLVYVCTHSAEGNS
jgi:hypothetical protein